MLKLKYIGLKTEYDVEFSNLTKNIVQVRGTLPAKTHGFTLSRAGKEDNWNYSGFTTIYREMDGVIQFSNDGSIYVEPVPKVNFYTNGGGVLNGESQQEAKCYEDLVIPEPKADENFEFTNWSPEIPESGVIDGNKAFTAIFTSTLPEPEPEPTLDERVTELETAVKSINDALGG